MNGQRKISNCFLAHGGAPYPRLGQRAVGFLILLALAALPASAAGSELKADGRWRAFAVASPGGFEAFLFEVVAGCRYRVTAEGKTLERVIIEVGPGEATVWSADSVDSPPHAIVTWDAQTDGVLEVRVKGFSVLTGKGRVRLQTLGPDDQPVKAHRRLLAPGGTLARVGSLWVDEPDRWELVLRVGRSYELRTLPGTAGQIRLRILDPEGQVIAEAEPDAERPYPRLAFASPDEALASPWRLEVEALDGGGGTYGVRLVEAKGAQPSESAPAQDLPETGLLPGPLTFAARPGDLAVLYIPKSSPYNPHLLYAKQGDRWVGVPADEVSPWGRRASMRTPEDTALVWFRAHRPAVYRFHEPRPKEAVLRIHAADVARGAPLLLGTGHDPTVMARGQGPWRTIGIGVCMPGWPYLFVAVARRRGSVSMRARTLDGRALAHRPIRGMALSRVAGLGPSLRFRVREPSLVLLQVKGKGWRGHALLRRASR